MLELKNVSGGYDSSIVVRDVSLTIPDGSVVALLGPNGAGKSTTLRLASGLLRPKSGEILLDGKSITRLSPFQRTRLGICHIFEGRGVFPSLTVRENLLMQAPKGMSERDVTARAIEAFPTLSKRLRQVAGTMSGGEQQMLAMARAYVTQPRVVLVDEASLGLAPLVVDGIFEFLERLSAEGVSLLVVEQYVNRALALASTVYILVQGLIAHAGPAKDLDEGSIFTLYAGQPPVVTVG